MISVDDIKKLDKKPAIRWLFVKLLGIQEGVLSNYPSCCIAWYLIREDAMWPIMKKFPKLWKWYYDKFFNINNGVHHIRCPIHQMSRERPEYTRCKKCNWNQLENEECFMCLMKRVENE